MQRIRGEKLGQNFACTFTRRDENDTLNFLCAVVTSETKMGWRLFWGGGAVQEQQKKKTLMVKINGALMANLHIFCAARTAGRNIKKLNTAHNIMLENAKK